MEVAEAQAPGRFTDQGLQALPIGWPWSTIDHIPLPVRVQCVRIERRQPVGQATAELASKKYLLIGYHDDGLWRAGWLVHEFREGVSVAVQQAVSEQLGCQAWAAVPIQELYAPSIERSLYIARTPTAVEMVATPTGLTPTPSATSTSSR